MRIKKSLKAFFIAIVLIIFSSNVSGSIALNYGVNLAGAEFSGGAVYPNAADFDYYKSKGLILIRIPFLWERIQKTLNGALDPDGIDDLDAVVSLANARGMKVILDMHNYGKYNGVLINTGSVTYAAFKNVWIRLADHYKAYTCIWAYGLMNEPALDLTVWNTAAQNAISGIRAKDTVHRISVYWKGMAFVPVTDPNNLLLYEAHIYFDKSRKGQYLYSYDADEAYPMIGVDRADEFLNWCTGNRVKGFFGEYGIPKNDTRWNTVLNNFLAFLKTNGMSGTYWAGGHAWGVNQYNLCCDPVGGVDAPQMSVLKNYTSATYTGNYSGDIFNYTGSVTTGNLAPGKKVFSSDQAGTTTSRTMVIDGSLTSYWANKAEVPSFITVDLGQSCSVNKFVLSHSSTHPTCDFKIQRSPDGMTFADAVVVTGNTLAVTSHIIPSTSMRYIRLLITKPVKTSDTDKTSRIKEFEIRYDTAFAGMVTEIDQNLTALQYNAEPVVANLGSSIIFTSNETGADLIEIHSLTGVLLAKLPFNNGQAIWNLKNVSGSPVSRGIYLAILNNKSRSVIKIGIK